MNLLQIRSLTKLYNSKGVPVRALDGVSINVEQGEFISIVGTSGSGKTTLLNIIGGLEYPTEGSVIMNGIDITDLSEEECTIFRRKNIGFIFQSFNLVPMLNVYENIVMPVKLAGEPVNEEFVLEIVKKLGIEDKLYQLPGALSGGQQQRAAAARALYTKPMLLLADEPTGNLDSKSSTEVVDLIVGMSRTYHQTVILVTHNEKIAKLADRIIRIEDGRVVCRNEKKI
jgi:putative ABC transport system ATP-binding protein